MKNKFVFIVGFIVLLASCSSTNNSTKFSSNPKSLPKVKYYVDTNQDGNFEAVELEEQPVPSQGKDQWTRDFYTSIKYPSTARKNGIEGIVMLDILIDEFGKVKEVNVKKGIYKECDEEAKRALLNSTKAGYSPPILNGQIVKCRMDLPVGFWLN